MNRIAKGIDLNTPINGGSSDTKHIPTESNGKVMGISIAENYSRTDLGKCFLTIYQDTNKPFDSVPLVAFLPEGGRQYAPIDIPFETGVPVYFDLKVPSPITGTDNIHVVLHSDKDKK